MAVNVEGGALTSCSLPGMARTGYDRHGKCSARDDDAGSHHICVDLHPANEPKNFCGLTGQTNWCDGYAECQQGSSTPPPEAPQQCPREKWCVCQWAFAAARAHAGESFCDHVQIDCAATNMEALTAYRRLAKQGQTQYVDALKCLSERCNLAP